MLKIAEIFAKAAKNSQNSLTEAQCYAVFEDIGIKTPKIIALKNPSELTPKLLESFESQKIVIKILSSKTLHKTEAGGVKIALKKDAKKVLEQMARDFNDTQGFMLAQFIDYPPFALGRELLLGARYDKAFGPVITLGAGGTSAEYLAGSLKEGVSVCSARAALEDKNALDAFLASSFIWHYTAGKARGAKQYAKEEQIKDYILKFAKVMTHFDGKNCPYLIEEMEINPLVAAEGGLIALDGVLRFKQSAQTQKRAKAPVSPLGIKALLEPKTVAVAGVSENKVNIGRIILRNTIAAGFPKENLFILKENCSEIDGVKCYASPKDFPKQIDSYVITVPASSAAQVVKDSALSGKVNGVVLISGGIGEKEGSQTIREEVDNIILEGKKINPLFTLNGSNSLGIVSNPAKINTLFIPTSKLVAPLGVNPKLAPCAFISQSGAFVVSSLGKMENIKPVYSVMTGNQLDVTVADLAAYLADDDKIKVLMLYIEGLKEGEGVLLQEAVKKARAKGKNIVIYLAGRTAAGQKAVMGHTASIAGDYPVAKTLLEAAGALMANTIEDFEALTQLACAVTETPPKNTKVFMISNAGFETSAMADNITAGSLIKLPFPDDKTKNEMAGIVKKYKLDNIVDVRNPFDTTPMCPDDAAVEIIECAAQSGLYGAIFFATIPLSPAVKTLESEHPDIMERLAQIGKKYKLPVFVSVSCGSKFAYYKQTVFDAGLCLFTTADNAVRKWEQYLRAVLKS